MGPGVAAALGRDGVSASSCDSCGDVTELVKPPQVQQ